MILDERTEFCDATALNTGAAGSYLIGDVIDTGDDGLNDVDELYLVIQVTTAVTSAGSATVSFSLASDSAAAIATDGSATVHATSAVIAKATLVAGYTVMVVELPKGTYERYVGVLQTTAVAALTAGAVNAFLTPVKPTWKSFPQAAGADINL